MRPVHAPIMLLAAGAAMLDDGAFLLVGATTATIALVLCGGSRLIAATKGIGRNNAAPSGTRLSPSKAPLLPDLARQLDGWIATDRPQ